MNGEMTLFTFLLSLALAFYLGFMFHIIINNIPVERVCLEAKSMGYELHQCKKVKL